MAENRALSLFLFFPCDYFGCRMKSSPPPVSPLLHSVTFTNRQSRNGLTSLATSHFAAFTADTEKTRKKTENLERHEHAHGALNQRHSSASASHLSSTALEIQWVGFSINACSGSSQKSFKVSKKNFMLISFQDPWQVVETFQYFTTNAHFFMPTYLV